jgi:DNA-binding beta-propeller fold protein YncE
VIDGQYAGYVDAAVDTDGRIYVTDVAGRSVSVIDNGTTTIVPITGGRPLSVAANPDNGEVYVTVLNDASTPGTSTLSVAEVSSGTSTTIATISTPVQGVAGSDAFSDMTVSPDGSRIFVTIPSGRSVAVIDTETHTVSGFATNGDGSADIPYRILFAPDGSEAYVVGANGTISVVTFANSAISV